MVLLTGGIYGAIILVNSLTHESTDNAFVAGTIVPIASEVRGRVIKVHIEDNAPVAAGQPLIEICRDDYVNALQEKMDAVSRAGAEEQELRASINQKRESLVQAKASLNAALAQEELSEKKLKRYQKISNCEYRI